MVSNASVCAFPSKYEGFPLALTEAMSAGLPCVGFKSCTGVNGLIVDGENGFLVEDGICDFAKKQGHCHKQRPCFYIFHFLFFTFLHTNRQHDISRR